MRYLLFFCLLSVVGCQSKPEHVIEKRGKTEPIEFFYQQRTYPDGRVNQKAMKQAAQAYVAEMARKSGSQVWEPIGPYNIGGRVTDLAVRQRANGSESIFLGAASGGVFRSNDGGESWTPIFDEQPSLAIGSITLSPHDEETIFVGTGEINAGGGSIAYEGTGIYQSTNNGDSWTNIGLPNSASIGEIAIHPTDPDIMYAACMGTLYEESEQRGIYRTTNGGETWERVLYQGSNTGGVTVLIDPENPQRIHATLWERYRRPNNRQYFGTSSGLYVSADGGETWTRNQFTATTNLSKISLARAPSNPSVMYLSAVNQGLELEGVYKSTDSGENWTLLSTDGELDVVPFEYWFNEIFVDPQDENVLHRLGFTASKTNTAGVTNSWSLVFPGVHVDQHAYWIDPTNSQRILLGNDGGLFESTNGGASYTQFLNLPITQSYANNVAPDDVSLRFSGNQDNGTWGTSAGQENQYDFLTGGDGFRIAIEPTNSSNFYTEYQYGNIFRHTNGLVVYIRNFMPPGQYNWNTPIVIDPVDPATVYTGAQSVAKSTNRGQNWTTISPSLIGDDAEFGNLPFNTIYALAVSSVDNDVIWAGLDNGKVWGTTDGGSNWTDISEGFPNRWVSSITPHPTEATAAYITFSGFRWNEDESHVYYFDLAEATLVDIGLGLPDVPVNEIIIDTATMHLFLATDIGVYQSIDGGQNWEVFGVGLPALVVSDLTLHEDTRQLFAGTYGRSLFMTQLGAPSSVREIAGLEQLSVSPNPTKGDFKVAMSLTKAAKLTLHIYSIDGRLITKLGQRSFSAGNQEWAVQLADIPPGNYVLRVEDDRGAVASERLVVF